MEPFQKPLTPDEEAVYLRQLTEGDAEQTKKAKDVIVQRNMRLVAHVAKKYQNVDEEMDDLISTGSLGLLKAVKTFDINKGRFATYACRCIDNELLMLLRSKKKTLREVSLFDPIGQDKEGNEIQLMDVIEQKNPDIVESMELENNTRIMYGLLRDVLTDRERKIIIMRYGLCGFREYTQNEIGEILGISRSYVSRIEKKALQKMRKGFVK